MRRLERNNAWGYAKEDNQNELAHLKKSQARVTKLSAQIRGLQQINTQIGPNLENLQLQSHRKSVAGGRNKQAER